MKLRIQGSSLRFRLTQKEVQRIHQQESVRELVQLGSSNPTFSYSLNVHTDERPLTVLYRNNEISVSIPKQMAQQWAATDQVGIEEHITLESKNTLHVLVEKDFRCLHRDVTEEPDQYPNPQETPSNSD